MADNLISQDFWNPVEMHPDQPDNGLIYWQGDRPILYVGRGDSSLDEWNANARLIASAPALLDALEDIIHESELTTLILGADLADSIKMAKHVVSKAKGESQ
ncbi:MAG: hypothetical protein OEZ02_00915 [Anaerolineae bacterium]|nr:hypothetical protein [Anaerolineae bacterium]